MKNYEKLFDATAYVLYQNDKSMNYTKLIKELYFADRESFKQTGFSITRDTYYSLPQGPILSSLYDLIMNRHKDKELQDSWNKVFTTNKYDISITQDNFNRMSLSRRDEKILSSYSDKFKDMDWKEIVDNYAHNKDFCPEWEPIKKGRKKLSVNSIFDSIGFSQAEKEIILENYNYFMQMD